MCGNFRNFTLEIFHGTIKFEERGRGPARISPSGKGYSKLDVRFHTKIAQCTHNMVMENLIPIIGNGVEVFAREVASTEFQQTILSHRRIFDAVREHKPFEAENEMRFHLLFNSNRYSGEPGEEEENP